MAQFYADENFPQHVVEQLRELGHDVLTTSESGKAGQKIPDEEVLSFATENNRILLTLNRKHFIRLHNHSTAHSGIIVCTFDPDFAAQAQRINDTLLDQTNFSGILLRVNRPQQ